MTLTTIYSNIPLSKCEQRKHLDWRRNRQECSIRMIALCAVIDVAKAKGARELWSMKPFVERSSWTNGTRGRARDEDGDTIAAVIEEDDTEEPM
uniref:Uncharacterized protein n=1 Tax=Oryza glumipatula TaxID=40148 RepID=A0A0E0B827_9ORYZ